MLSYIHEEVIKENQMRLRAETLDAQFSRAFRGLHMLYERKGFREAFERIWGDEAGKRLAKLERSQQRRLPPAHYYGR